MAAAGNPSFLYSVGVDTTQAATQLRDFASKTAPGLLDVKPIELRLDTTAASTSVRRFISYATDALKAIPPVNVTFNFSGASRSLNAFMANFARNASAIKELEASMLGLSRAGSSLGASFSQFSGGMGSLRENLRGAAGGATLFAGESERAVGSAERLGAAAEKNSTAMDYLGKIAVADVAKILAWGAAFEVVQGAIHGFTNSLEQSGEVQMEQTLQRLYNSTINVNQAFTNAELIAKQWGGNIVDVQQAIGLWTKQTNDLAAATMLAAKGEEMARASGIATADVYKDSLAIGTQMGLAYGQLPAVYDQITRGALKLGETLRGVNDRASEGTEAMKDLFQGLARASATLSANSFTDADKLKGTAAIIAIVANQITAMGDSGKTAATNLATMFGALSQGGPKRGEWESILGVDAFKNADSLLQAMQKHLGELQQAQANGKLGVRPQQVETLATMEKSLQHISDLYHDIASNSKGALDTVAMAEMATYQAQVDKLKTAIQALEISIGTQLLPQMESWVNWLGSSAIPGVESLSPALLGASQDVLRLVAAWAALQGIGKVSAFWQATTSQVNANTAALNANIITETRARAAGFEDAAALGKLQSTLAVYNENVAATTQANTLLSESYAKLGSEANLTAEQMARITPAALEAGNALNELRAQTTADITAFSQLDAAVEQGDGQLNLFTTAVSRAAAAEVELKSATEAAGGAALLSVVGWQRAAQGIGLIATNAIATLGPLAAMTAGLWAAQQAAKAGNSGDNAALAIQNLAHDRTDTAAANAGALGYDQNRTPADFVGGIGTSIQGTLGALWYGTGQQQTSGAGNSLVYQMLRSQQYGSQTAGDLAGMNRTQFSDRGAYDKYEHDLEATGKSFTEMQGVTQQTSTEMKSLEDQLHKMAQASNGYAAALAHPMGASEGNRSFYQPPAGKGGSGGNPDATALKQTTDAYSSLVKSKQDEIAADNAEIQTAETLIGLYGQQPKYMAEIKAAYADKITQLGSIVSATKTYIATLTSQIENDQKQLASSSLTTKQRQQLNADLLKTENALTVAHGALLESQAKVTQAEANEASQLEKLNEKQNEQKYGLVDLTTQLKAMSDALQLLKGHTSEQLVLAQQDVASLLQKKTALEGLVAQYGVGSAAAHHWQVELDAVNAALKTTHGVVTTDTADITKLTDTINKAIETLAKGNFDEAAGILGINKQTISYVDQMLSAMEQIDTTQQQINRDRVGANPAQQQLLNAEQQELNLRRQLLPIEQQILQIRSSPLYTAWESEIDKMGQDFGDKLVQKMFGGGGATGGLQVIHQMLSGVMENVFNSLWKNASSSITDKMFGLGGPDQQLETALTSLKTQLTAQFQSFNSTVTGPLTQFQLNFHQDVQTLANSVGSSGGVPGGSSTVPGALSGGGPSAFASYEQEFGIYNPMQVGQSYDDTATIAENTGITNQTLSSMQQDAVNQFSQLTGLNITGGSSSSGGSASALAAFAAAGGIMSPQAMMALGGGGGGGLGGLLGGGGGGILGALGGLGGALGSPMGVIMSALTGGSIFGSLLGSNTGKAGTAGRQDNGMLGGILGLLGGFGGIALSGPLGLAIAATPIGMGLIAAAGLLGAFGGSMFGDHFPISDEPDIGEPQIGGVSYGQFVANMTGSPGSFNGTTINPMSQYSGPQDAESYQLEQDVQKVLGAGTGQYSPQLVSLAKQLQQFNPGNEPYGFSINGEKNDVLTLHSGASVNVQTYQGLVQQFMQLFGQQGNKPLAPILSINGAGVGGNWAPNLYNTPGMTNQNLMQMEQSSWGSYNSSTPYNTPGVGTGSGGPPVIGNYTGGSFGGSSGGGSGGNTTVQLVVDGKVIAQIVNAYNAQYLLNSGQSIDRVPIIQ